MHREILCGNNGKILDKLSYLGLFCHFIKDKMGQNFHKAEAVRLTAFSEFFFMPSPSPFKKIADGFCVLEPSIRKLLTRSSVD